LVLIVEQVDPDVGDVEQRRGEVDEAVQRRLGPRVEGAQAPKSRNSATFILRRRHNFNPGVSVRQWSVGF
jgi:hypothetical protein